MPRLGHRHARLGGSLHLHFKAKPKREAGEAPRRGSETPRDTCAAQKAPGVGGCYRTAPPRRARVFRATDPRP